MTDKNARSLGELVANIVVGTAKYSAIMYPTYVGIMTEVKDSRFFEQAINSLPFVAGVGVAHLAIKGVRYLRDHYRVERKEQPTI